MERDLQGRVARMWHASTGQHRNPWSVSAALATCVMPSNLPEQVSSTRIALRRYAVLSGQNPASVSLGLLKIFVIHDVCGLLQGGGVWAEIWMFLHGPHEIIDAYPASSERIYNVIERLTGHHHPSLGRVVQSGVVAILTINYASHGQSLIRQLQLTIPRPWTPTKR